MALFGSSRDIGTFRGVSRELLEDIISQAVGYYKIAISDSPVNMYGEAQTKYYIGPVLINCLIERGDFDFNKEQFGVQVVRSVTFRFLKQHLEEANVVPEVGDVIMYDENYYHVGNVNENQLILGKDNDYAYQPGLQNFGNSYSIILETHLTSPDVLGITENRL
jgi:hypothetical protein